ncbi:MAG: sugar transferase [Candidatus Omnitrophota bacterium]
MLKENATTFRRIMILVDFSFLIAAFFIAYFWRSSIHDLEPLRAYLWILPTMLLVWTGGLFAMGIYESFRLRSAFELAGRIILVGTLGLLLFSSLNYLVGINYVSRSFTIAAFGLGTLFLILERVIVVTAFRVLRSGGYNFRNIIVVGTGPRAVHFIRGIKDHAEFGLQIIGIIDDDPSKVGQDFEGYKVIGTIKDISSILLTGGITVDQVVFIVPRRWIDRIQEPVLFCETVGISVNVAVDFFDLQFIQGKETSIFGMPFLMFDSTPGQDGQLFVKRLMDIVLSGTALLLLSPLFLIVGLLIKLTSPGPVLFRQQRSTLNHRTFALYKFRTMYQDAEARLEELKKFNQMEGPVFKMDNDPRITPLGQFLRKTSIDELPQLWNILWGQMSIVGPRPPLPREVEEYDPWQRRRLSMRPGLTCLWQISGRNKITNFDQWMRLDLEYIDNWSIWLDLKIILKTFPVVLFGIGAK